MKRLATLAAILWAVSLSGASPQGNAAGVFLLEMPELHQDVQENSTVTLSSAFVSRILLHIHKTPDEVSYGQIHVRLNGEAANTIMTVGTESDGILCALDLYFRPGFLLHSGRNAVEIWAQSIYGRFWYASFLLDVGGEQSLREIQVETNAARSGEKPPVIELLTPEGPVEHAAMVEVRGVVETAHSSPKLLVEGRAVALKPGDAPAGARGLKLVTGDTGKVFAFTARVPVSSGQSTIQLTATDDANNKTQVTIPVVQGAHATGQRYAVIIGVSKYQDRRINLRYADRDAASVRDFLIDPNGGRFPPDHVQYLVNENATSANIRTALLTFLTKPQANDLVFFYFAGHGAPDPRRPQNLYLLSYDTDINNMGGTAVPMWEIEPALERTVQGNLVSFIDACHSAGLGEGLPNLSNQSWTHAGYGQKHAIITASEVNQFSQESDRWGGGHGVFTYFLLEGMKGAADSNHDHQVTVGKLFDYVRKNVAAATNGAQSPTALAGSSRGLLLNGAPVAAKLFPQPADFLEAALWRAGGGQ
ncbi:MAG: caspase family protein [Candidatus Acidiferrales bacterium]